MIKSMKKFKKKDSYITFPPIVWALLLIIPVGLFCIYLYTDIMETTMNGLKVWYLIFGEGHINDFYRELYPMVENAPQAGYDFFLYLVFAIWDLPLFIYEKITGISFSAHYITVLYAKMIVLFFMILASWQVYRLAYHVTEDKEKSMWTVFSFVFSITVFSPVMVTGNYDIISVFFTLCGINAYFDDKYKKFSLYFACAIACKMFALWVFIPLVLLKFKKLYQVILAGIAGISVIVLPRVLFGIMDSFNASVVHAAELVMNIDMTRPNKAEESMALSHSYVINDFMWSGEAPVFMPSVPLFFVFTFILWIGCWFCKKELSKYEKMFYSSLGMFIFFLCCDTYPYWIVLLAPYMAVMICYKWSAFSQKVLLEACAGIGYICVKAIRCPQCFNYNLIVSMIKNEEYNPDFCYIGLYSYISKGCDMLGLLVDNFRTLALGIFGAATIMFLFYARPGRQEGLVEIVNKRQIFLAKALVCIGVSALPVFGWIVRIMTA